MFHTHVINILSGCCIFEWFFMCFQVFLKMFQMHVSSALSVYRRMLQNVSKVDRVLHKLQWLWCLADNGPGRASAPTSLSAPRPLLFSPSPPFPSLHLASVLVLALALG
jgi:hypothetical protein